MVSNMIAEEDTDGDGLLSATESSFSSEMFTSLDTDSDGLLSSDELVAGLEDGENNQMGPPPPPPMDASEAASSIMDSQDTDGDSVLSVSESGLSDEEFDVLDTNEDGVVSIDELQAGIEARQAERADESSSTASTTTTEDEETETAVSTTTDTFKSLLQSLAQNDATDAYSSQNWLYDMLESESKTLTVNA